MQQTSVTPTQNPAPDVGAFAAALLSSNGALAFSAALVAIGVFANVAQIVGTILTVPVASRWIVRLSFLPVAIGLTVVLGAIFTRPGSLGWLAVLTFALVAVWVGTEGYLIARTRLEKRLSDKLGKLVKVDEVVQEIDVLKKGPSDVAHILTRAIGQTIEPKDIVQATTELETQRDTFKKERDAADAATRAIAHMLTVPLGKTIEPKDIVQAVTDLNERREAFKKERDGFDAILANSAHGLSRALGKTIDPKDVVQAAAYLEDQRDAFKRDLASSSNKHEDDKQRAVRKAKEEENERATSELLARLEDDDKRRPLADFLCVTPFVSVHKNHHVLLEYGATNQDHVVTVTFGIAATNSSKHSFRPSYMKDLSFFLSWPGCAQTIPWSKPERQATTEDVSIENGMGRVPVHYDGSTKTSKLMALGAPPPLGQQFGTLEVLGKLLLESDMWTGTKEIDFRGLVSIPIVVTYTEPVLVAVYQCGGPRPRSPSTPAEISCWARL